MAWRGRSGTRPGRIGRFGRTMAARTSVEPVFDATLRVGCELVYEVKGTATLLLNIRPCVDAHHQVVEEDMRLGDRRNPEEFVDSHGNRVYRLLLREGKVRIRHDAIVRVPAQLDNHYLRDRSPILPSSLPPDLLRYTLPSRYCDSDKLAAFAWKKFGHHEGGWPRVQAISLWIHRNIEYRYMSGRPDLSAWDILERGYGVCRDFAHLAVALNRCFNIPTRYVTGHLPDMGRPDPEGHMDFHAYAEVYLGGRWHTVDARFHEPRIGRIKVSCGRDAVDGAFSTVYGIAELTYFQVWAYQVPLGKVHVGDPVDFSLRLDNRHEVATDRTA